MNQQSVKAPTAKSSHIISATSEKRVYRLNGCTLTDIKGADGKWMCVSAV